MLTVRGRLVTDGGEQLVKSKKGSSSSQSLPSKNNIKMAWLLQVTQKIDSLDYIIKPLSLFPLLTIIALPLRCVAA